MRDSHKCPKCGHNEILRIEGFVGAHGIGNNITAGVTVFDSVKLPRYVCCRCGYLEEWVDRGDLPKVIDWYKNHPKKGTFIKGEQ